MFSRRQFLRSLPAIPLATHSGMSLAQLAPGRPVHFIVGASTGTNLDTTARTVGEAIGKNNGPTIVVENRPGAGGALGSSVVARAPSDGHTMLFTGITHFSARHSGEAADIYDPLADFKGVARLCSATLVLAVPVNSPYQTLQDLIDDMRKRPGEVNFSSGGVGSTSHLCTVVLNDMTQTKARHIPYRGNAQAVTDTAAGVVAFTFQGFAGVNPLIQAGKLRALATTGLKRSDNLPDVPTCSEAGVPGYEMGSWIGVFAPAATSDAVVRQMSGELAKVANSAEFANFCAKQSMFVDLLEHQDFQSSLPAEDARWRRVAELVKKA